MSVEIQTAEPKAIPPLTRIEVKDREGDSIYVEPSSVDDREIYLGPTGRCGVLLTAVDARELGRHLIAWADQLERKA